MFLFMMDFTSLIGLVPLLMLMVVFPKQKMKHLYDKSIIFLLFKFILSGGIYTIESLYQIRFDDHSIYFNTDCSIIVITIIYILKMRWLNDQQLINQFIYEVRIFCGSNEIKGSGFVDTGNHLVDEKTCIPIMMVPKEIYVMESWRNF